MDVPHFVENKKGEKVSLNWDCRKALSVLLLLEEVSMAVG
jgi:hypothetical protein